MTRRTLLQSLAGLAAAIGLGKRSAVLATEPPAKAIPGPPYRLAASSAGIVGTLNPHSVFYYSNVGDDVHGDGSLERPWKTFDWSRTIYKDHNRWVAEHLKSRGASISSVRAEADA